MATQDSGRKVTMKVEQLEQGKIYISKYNHDINNPRFYRICKRCSKLLEFESLAKAQSQEYCYDCWSNLLSLASAIDSKKSAYQRNTG